MTDITITLTGDVADRLSKLVRERDYASPEEAVNDALAALEGDDLELEHWLKTEIAARYEESVRNPDRAISAEELRRRVFDTD